MYETIKTLANSALGLLTVVLFFIASPVDAQECELEKIQLEPDKVVYGKSGEPQQLRVLRTGPKQIQIFWKAPDLSNDTRSSITRYEIVKIADYDVIKLFKRSGERTSFVDNNAPTHQSDYYNYRVRAVFNDNSYSSFAWPIQISQE